MSKTQKLTTKLSKKSTKSTIEFDDDFYDDDFEDFDFGIGDGNHIDVSSEEGLRRFLGRPSFQWHHKSLRRNLRELSSVLTLTFDSPSRKAS
jgi:hypothetical protein